MPTLGGFRGFNPRDWRQFGSPSEPNNAGTVGHGNVLKSLITDGETHEKG